MAWQARSDELVMTQSGDDLLVYDQRRHVIHHLEPVAARIWRACDGQRNTEDIAHATRTDRHAVDVVLSQLSDADLLVNAMVPVEAQRLSRRKALALAGAGTAVISISAPMAAAAATPIPGQCWYLSTCAPECTWSSMIFNYERCRELDSCSTGGGGESGGGCYKWTVNPDDPFTSW